MATMANEEASPISAPAFVQQADEREESGVAKNDKSSPSVFGIGSPPHFVISSPSAALLMPIMPVAERGETRESQKAIAFVDAAAAAANRIVHESSLLELPSAFDSMDNTKTGLHLFLFLVFEVRI